MKKQRKNNQTILNGRENPAIPDPDMVNTNEYWMGDGRQFVFYRYEDFSRDEREKKVIMVVVAAVVVAVMEADATLSMKTQTII